MTTLTFSMQNEEISILQQFEQKRLLKSVHNSRYFRNKTRRNLLFFVFSYFTFVGLIAYFLLQ